MLGGEIGEDLRALLTAESARRLESFLGAAQQVQQRGAPSGAVGSEDRQLLRGRFAVGLGADIDVELPGRDRGRRRR